MVPTIPRELNITGEVAALHLLTARQLCARYAEVFGEAARTKNKVWLIRRTAWRLQALAEGDLSERAGEKARVSFVSVTQQFNTATSMNPCGCAWAGPGGRARRHEGLRLGQALAAAVPLRDPCPLAQPLASARGHQDAVGSSGPALR
jgi:hypothetical protein